MTTRHLMLLVGLTLATVFVLAAGWEFALEGLVRGPYGRGLEVDGPAWEFIIATTALTALAMVVPVAVCLKVIAERKRAQRAVRLANQELGTRVEEKTAKLREAIRVLRGEIIEHRRTEAVLQESEERLRSLVENIHEVFWMTDPERSEVLYVSPAYERVWGRSRESLYRSPLSFAEAVHPDDRERVLASLANATEGTYDEEYRIERPDGSVRWVRDRAFPVRDEWGRLRCIVGMAEDLTRLRRVPTRRDEAERRGPPPAPVAVVRPG